MADSSPASNGTSSSSTGNNLPPLADKFPAEIYPIREIGTGFTAQSVRGADAEACAATAAEMMIESRAMILSSVSSEGSGPNALAEVEPFPVPDLPLPPDAAKDGLLILRNERLFPGMVGISLPLKGTLWVREDGTFNLSGFFRRQIPKFETAALVTATSRMDEGLDVYHALYRPVLEHAASRQQFKVMRTVIEAGLTHYRKEGPARQELVELRRRVMALRAQATTPGRDSMGSIPSLDQPASQRDSWVSTEEVMETRRRISDSKKEQGSPTDPKDPKDSAVATDGSRRPSMPSGEMSDDFDDSGKGRSHRTSSGNERSSKIAQQVVTGAAPKQQTPFRLWKSQTGKEGYDKKTPS